MKAFRDGLLSAARSPRERLLRIKSSNSSLLIYPLVGRGEKNMFTISAARAVDDTPIRYIFEPSKQNIHCRRKQSLMVNNWFNTVSWKVELSLCLSRRSWLHLLALISQCPAAEPSHRSRGGQNQNNDAVCATNLILHMHCTHMMIYCLHLMQDTNLLLEECMCAVTRRKVSSK